MRPSSIFALAVAYTLLMTIAVELETVPGAIVPAVAWVWFSLGRMVGRRGDPITRWGRQS